MKIVRMMKGSATAKQQTDEPVQNLIYDDVSSTFDVSYVPFPTPSSPLILIPHMLVEAYETPPPTKSHISNVV